MLVGEEGKEIHVPDCNLQLPTMADDWVSRNYSTEHTVHQKLIIGCMRDYGAQSGYLVLLVQCKMENIYISL